MHYLGGQTGELPPSGIRSLSGGSQKLIGGSKQRWLAKRSDRENSAPSLWIRIGWRLYDLLARFAGTGVAVQEAGTGLEAAGQQIAEVLARVPVIGRTTGARPPSEPRIKARAAAASGVERSGLRPYSLNLGRSRGGSNRLS